MCNLVSTQREDFRLQEGWAGMPNPSNWYVISIFCSFFVHFLLIVRDFRRFSGVMMHLEGLRTKEVQEGWTDMPTPPKWYVFRFFGHFFADCS